MPPLLPRPDDDAIRDALARYAPALAGASIEPLGEGWTFWAVRAGDHVLRFPKLADSAPQLSLDRNLLPRLSPHISLRIPVPDVYGDEGPNGLPFLGYPLVPGVPLIEAVEPLPATARSGPTGLRPAHSFGHDLGTFLRQLHDFPIEQAIDLGIELIDGPRARARRIEFYEQLIRRVFPLINCEARTYTEQRFETYLNDSANFVFEPCLIHHDLDRQNCLIDPQTGELSGVIDFGDAVVGNPAGDFWLPLRDFEAIGIVDQLPALIEAYGRDRLDLERVQIDVDFTDFRWPFYDILYGLDIEDQAFVEGGIKALNASLPGTLRC
jgi:aminoglycoside 2''-phosphotransferase